MMTIEQMETELALMKHKYLQEVTRLQKNLERLQDDLDLTKNDLTESRSEVDDFKNTISSLHDDLHLTKHNLSKSQSQVSEYKTTVSSLSDKLDRVCKMPSDSSIEVSQVKREREREMFYLTTHSTHFIYGYMATDIWLRTILIVRKETRCCHIGYSYRLTARVLLYTPSPQIG